MYVYKFSYSYAAMCTRKNTSNCCLALNQTSMHLYVLWLQWSTNYIYMYHSNNIYDMQNIQIQIITLCRIIGLKLILVFKYHSVGATTDSPTFIFTLRQQFCVFPALNARDRICFNERVRLKYISIIHFILLVHFLMRPALNWPSAYNIQVWKWRAHSWVIYTLIDTKISIWPWSYVATFGAIAGINRQHLSNQ